jgi:predicted transcriptional regulator
MSEIKRSKPNNHLPKAGEAFKPNTPAANREGQKAALKARTREIEKDKLIEQLHEITGEEYYIGKKKKKSDGVRFVQMIQENILYLVGLKYLTTEEKAFLFDIQPYIGFDSNCIVQDVKEKAPIPMTQTDLSNALGTSKTKISRVVNALVKKGIISKAESGQEGVNARSYALFLNPNILFCGDKAKVNETLKTMFRRPSIKIKQLKELPVKLF